jgi:predicted ferric reductase
MTQKKFNLLSWGLFVMAIFLPSLAYIQNNSGNLNLSAIRLFPVLGVMAWLIMWSHYLLGAIRLHTGLKKSSLYKVFSEVAVFLLILLHPFLLAAGQYDLTQTIPPTSFFDYVGGGKLKLAVAVGTLALLIFISYDVFTRLKRLQFVAKNWVIISYLQIVAMSLIFFHGLRLGQHLQTGWLKIIWVLCGLVFWPCAFVVLKADLLVKADQDEA